jgi:hypothetical protein
MCSFLELVYIVFLCPISSILLIIQAFCVTFELSLQKVLQWNTSIDLSKLPRVHSSLPSCHSVLHPLDVAPSNAVSGNESHLRFVQNQCAGFVESDAKEFWVFE